MARQTVRKGLDLVFVFGPQERPHQRPEPKRPPLLPPQKKKPPHHHTTSPRHHVTTSPCHRHRHHGPTTSPHRAIWHTSPVALLGHPGSPPVPNPDDPPTGAANEHVTTGGLVGGERCQRDACDYNPCDGEQSDSEMLGRYVRCMENHVILFVGFIWLWLQLQGFLFNHSWYA